MKNIPILILHGWNLSAAKFLPLQREFNNRGYKTYCIDLPGFGSTCKPENPLYLSDYVKFVKDFLQKEKIDKIIIIGHSFGGRIAVKMGAENPKFLNTLILTGVPGIVPVRKSKILFFLYLAKFGNILFSLPLLSFFKITARKFLYRIASATDFYNTNDNLRETFKNIVKENLEPYLAQIQMPTLLLWGRDDGLVPIGVAEKMNKIIKNSKLVIINNARHGVPWTHPKEFTEEIEKFLASVE